MNVTALSTQEALRVLVDLFFAFPNHSMLLSRLTSCFTEVLASVRGASFVPGRAVWLTTAATAWLPVCRTRTCCMNIWLWIATGSASWSG